MHLLVSWCFVVTYHSGSFVRQEQSDRDEQQNHCSSILPNLYAPQSVLQTMDSLWQSPPSVSDLGSRDHWYYCVCSTEVWVVGWWGSGRSILIPVWSPGRGWHRPNLYDTLGYLKRENVKLNSISLAIHSVIASKDGIVCTASAPAWLHSCHALLMQFQVTRWSLQESHFFPFPQPIFCLFRSVITLTFSTRMFRIPGVFVFILTHARPRPHTKWPNWCEMCCIRVPWDRMTTHLKRNENWVLCLSSQWTSHQPKIKYKHWDKKFWKLIMIYSAGE